MSRPTRKLRRPRPDLSKLQQSWSKVLRSCAVKFEDLHNLCVHQSTSVTYRVRTQSAGSKNESHSPPPQPLTLYWGRGQSACWCWKLLDVARETWRQTAHEDVQNKIVYTAEDCQCENNDVLYICLLLYWLFFLSFLTPGKDDMCLFNLLKFIRVIYSVQIIIWIAICKRNLWVKIKRPWAVNYSFLRYYYYHYWRVESLCICLTEQLHTQSGPR